MDIFLITRCRSREASSPALSDKPRLLSKSDFPLRIPDMFYLYRHITYSVTRKASMSHAPHISLCQRRTQMPRQTPNHHMRAFFVPKEIDPQAVEGIVIDTFFQVPLQ